MTAVAPARQALRAADGSRPEFRLALCAAGEIYGGVEEFVYTYARHLKEERGLNPAVVLFHEGRLADKLRRADVPLEIVDVRPVSLRTAVRGLSECFRRRGADLVHAHGYKAGILCSLAAGPETALLKTEHGAPEPFRGWAGAKMSAYLTLDKRLTEWRADRVVYVTKDLKRQKPLRVRTGEAAVIHNGAPLPPPEAGPSPFEPGFFHAGTVGRLSPVKGQDVLLEALAKTAPADRLRLHIFGEGPLEAKLKRRTRALGLEDRVRFWGFQKDVRRYMAHLDAFVLPSLHEGLPYTLLEAMGLGLPIIASRAGGPAEILEHGRTALLCPPGNSRALARRIHQLSTDEGLRRRLAANARRAAAEKFGVAAMADRYLEICREIVREKKSGMAWLSWERHRRTVQLASALGAELRILPKSRRRIFNPWAPMFKSLIALLFSRVRLIFVQNPSLALTTLACAVKPLKGYKLVADLHSYFTLHVHRAVGLRNKVYKALSRFCIRRADLTIVTNEPLKAMVESLGGRAYVLQDKLPLLPSGERKPLRGRRNVAFVCTYSADEPLAEVLEAARGLEEGVCLYVTGRFPRGFTRTGLPANVELTGFLEEEDYASLLTSADAVMVLTTREHTLVCGGYEAMALGKPLILSNKRALRDYFGPAAVYVDNDAASIRRGMTEAVERAAELENRTRDAAQKLRSDWKERFAGLARALEAL
ncbi:MAG: glycosyltransferase [Elusimicrobiota bacterium]